MSESYLSLGSNIGNRKFFMEQAEKLIRIEIGSILKRSSLYETEPWGFHHPVNFFNRVLCINTELFPEALLSHCIEIEKQLGRKRENNKYEARCIDIDILFYGDQIVDSENLKIPHPYIHIRRFVLEPLNEIASELVHPILKKEIGQLLKECLDRGKVIRI
jgi:2-amino-4-hydroxy-6-hydroxymethyldihydropteridine diphosphokinase